MRDEQEVLPRLIPTLVFWQSRQLGLTVDSQASVVKAMLDLVSVGFFRLDVSGNPMSGVTVELEKTADVLTLARSLDLSYFLVGWSLTSTLGVIIH